jgi:hypothetical protein
MGVRSIALLSALLLAGCGADSRSSDTTPADEAQPAAQSAAPAKATEPASPPPSQPSAASGAGKAPVPTVEDSAAAAREDVSPEWKMNERNMGPYRDCMAQANTAPERIRPRLQAACANLPDAPAN